MERQKHFEIIDKLVSEIKLGDDVLSSITPEGVLLITLNRPKKFNSLTTPMYFEIMRLLTNANTDPKIKVIVLKSNGKNFCAGNDLNNFMLFPEYMEPEVL